MFKTLEDLVNIIRDRKSSQDASSYTTKLLKDKSLSVEKVKEEVAATASIAEPPPTADAVSQIPVEPLTAEELKEMIEKNKNDEGDDCLMCGS